MATAGWMPRSQHGRAGEWCGRGRKSEVRIPVRGADALLFSRLGLRSGRCKITGTRCGDWPTTGKLPWRPLLCRRLRDYPRYRSRRRQPRTPRSAHGSGRARDSFSFNCSIAQLQYSIIAWRIGPMLYSSHTTQTGMFTPGAKLMFATSSSHSPLVQFRFRTTRLPLFCSPMAKSVPALLIANCRGKAP